MKAKFSDCFPLTFACNKMPQTNVNHDKNHKIPMHYINALDDLQIKYESFHWKHYLVMKKNLDKTDEIKKYFIIIMKKKNVL